MQCCQLIDANCAGHGLYAASPVLITLLLSFDYIKSSDASILSNVTAGACRNWVHLVYGVAVIDLSGVKWT